MLETHDIWVTSSLNNPAVAPRSSFPRLSPTHYCRLGITLKKKCHGRKKYWQNLSQSQTGKKQRNLSTGETSENQGTKLCCEGSLRRREQQCREQSCREAAAGFRLGNWHRVQERWGELPYLLSQLSSMPNQDLMKWRPRLTVTVKETNRKT